MVLSDVGHAAMLRCLHELADKEFQERVWVDGQGLEVSTPSELVSQLFDDTGLAELLDESEETIIDQQVDTLLRELRALVNGLDLYSEAETLIAQPEWGDVRRVAAKAAELAACGSSVN